MVKERQSPQISFTSWCYRIFKWELFGAILILWQIKSVSYCSYWEGGSSRFLTVVSSGIQNFSNSFKSIAMINFFQCVININSLLRMDQFVSILQLLPLNRVAFFYVNFVTNLTSTRLKAPPAQFPVQLGFSIQSV